MKIKLHFINLTSSPLVLSRKIPSPAEVRVANSLEALRSGKLEYNSNLDPAVAELPRSPSFGDAPDLEYFTILLPKQSFETQVSATVFGTRARKEGFVEKGNHVLQLGLDVWPYKWPFSSPVDGHKLAKRWSKYGILVTGYFYTEPIILTIPDKFRVGPCD
jgi:hypothetical protein